MTHTKGEQTMTNAEIRIQIKKLQDIKIDCSGDDKVFNILYKTINDLKQLIN